MLIIGKYSDFYDAACNSVDESVVFDRRGAVLVEPGWLPRWLVDEESRGPLKISKKTIRLETDEYFLLEAGLKQYLIKATNIVAKRKDVVSSSSNFDFSCDFEVVRTFDENVHLFEPVVSLHKELRRTPADANDDWRYNEEYYVDFTTLKDFDFSRERMKDRVDLPILSESGLAKVMDADDVYKTISKYYLTATKKQGETK